MADLSHPTDRDLIEQYKGMPAGTVQSAGEGIEVTRILGGVEFKSVSYDEKGTRIIHAAHFVSFE